MPLAGRGGNIRIVTQVFMASQDSVEETQENVALTSATLCGQVVSRPSGGPPAVVEGWWDRPAEEGGLSVIAIERVPSARDGLTSIRVWVPSVAPS